MRKFIGAVIILALIVSLGYVKTLLDDHKTEIAYEKGQVLAQRDVDKVKQTADSLKTAMTQKEIEYADSLLQKDKTYSAQIDSLTDIIENQSAQNENLQKKLKTAATSTKKKTTKTVSQSEKVINYYKTRYAQLPKDLSEYEKKIAVAEIRDETLKKFSITQSELTKIRQKYNLSY